MWAEKALATGELVAPVKDLLNRIADQIINPLVNLGFGIALLYFLWGVYSYIQVADSDKRKEKQMHLVFGVLGLAIMVSAWGILQFICTNVACQ